MNNGFLFQSTEDKGFLEYSPIYDRKQSFQMNVPQPKEILPPHIKKKIKAYCPECYQFFYNTPFSKNCISHSKKKCNTLPCKKDNGNECIRKFSNINSANRHTYCLTKTDADKLDKNMDIYYCLGKKRAHENSNSNEEMINKDDTYENVHQLIEQIDHVNFNDEPVNYGFNEEPFKCNFNFEDYQSKSSLENKNNVSNEDTIEHFFELVKKNTYIKKAVMKKLIQAFKKKGIHNVKILRLFKEKHNNWDFLINEFKDVTSEIEGVTLCIEYLLK